MSADERSRNLGVAAEAQDDDDVAMDDTAEQNNARSTVRELYLPSVEQCPVLEWEPHNSSLWMAAEHSHAFCSKRGVFSYAHKLDEAWDQRAKAITEPPTEPLVDEEDLQRYRVAGEDDDEEMDEEDGSEKSAHKESFLPAGVAASIPCPLRRTNDDSTRQ